MSPTPDGAAPLRGRRVVTTRDTPGRLDDLLVAAGATVVHVPLIEITAPPDDGVGLIAGLARLADASWLVVTSQHGAAAVGAAARVHEVRLASVGTRTAEVLTEVTGRPVDLIPDRQTAADLIAAFPPAEHPGELAVVAVGDLAASTLEDGLRELGYEVVSAVAYRTQLRSPSPSERTAALAADAVVFASGSSARAWAAAMGTATPSVVVAIGPTTAASAAAVGLQVTAVAADHSLPGVVATVVEQLG
ncbi:MAG TPA: uroporphyrinogen-III synthase [Ilumatobacter sp.]|nr:uroporphyrinogen-III synthase [Ilumatobacter sp.]